ncbi:hypothetical protein BVC80_8851g12 [Macleaya cordata]|uniref:Uncharacterized protein n=1 Tax=Macleaya cordata TaxID=56857 RepID=A0A200PXY9_MACCD|nr:hypothetical protein BVC80_8851g12 [Macleaya cordata]
MAFSSATLSQYSLSCLSSSHPYPQTPQIQRKIIITNPHWKALSIRAAANAAEPEKKQKISQNPIQDSSSSSSSIKTQTSSIKMPKKPVYSSNEERSNCEGRQGEVP